MAKPALFLDRDGVINRRIVGDYVKKIDDFVFEDGVLEALAALKDRFEPILVVTNQQGVGKGWMSLDDLAAVHHYMREEVEKQGGRIDEVYFCSDLSRQGSLYRKPQVGMGLQARKDFSQIRFKKSVMVGDSLSDMEFGKKLGMTTVWIGTDTQFAARHARWIDAVYPSLIQFARLWPE